jgi:hypothetical protein
MTQMVRSADISAPNATDESEVSVDDIPMFRPYVAGHAENPAIHL